MGGGGCGGLGGLSVFFFLVGGWGRVCGWVGVLGWDGAVPVCGVQCSLVAVLGVSMPEVGAAGALVSGASSSVMVVGGYWLLMLLLSLFLYGGVWWLGLGWGGGFWLFKMG